MYEGVEEYKFYGTHAIKVFQLCESRIFKRFVDVLMVAPIVGFEYRRTAEENHEDGEERKIFLKQLQDADARFEMNYKTIVLLDKEHDPNEESRFKKAFQTLPENRDGIDLDRYESYVRGGIDFLHEKIFGNGNTSDERLREIYDLTDSFADWYGLRDY